VDGQPLQHQTQFIEVDTFVLMYLSGQLNVDLCYNVISVSNDFSVSEFGFIKGVTE